MIYLLLAQLRPEIWHAEYFLEKDVVLRSCSWPFIELVHDSDIGREVFNWFNQEDSRGHCVHTTLPVLVAGVVRLRLPVGHC